MAVARGRTSRRPPCTRASPSSACILIISDSTYPRSSGWDSIAAQNNFITELAIGYSRLVDCLVERGGGDEGLPAQVRQLPVHPLPDPLVDLLRAQDERMVRRLAEKTMIKTKHACRIRAIAQLLFNLLQIWKFIKSEGCGCVCVGYTKTQPQVSAKDGT